MRATDAIRTTTALLVAALAVSAAVGPAAAQYQNDAHADADAAAATAGVAVGHVVYDGESVVVDVRAATEGSATVHVEALEGEYAGEGSYEVDGNERIVLPVPEDDVTLRVTVDSGAATYTETVVIRVERICVPVRVHGIVEAYGGFAVAAGPVDHRSSVHTHADAEVDPCQPPYDMPLRNVVIERLDADLDVDVDREDAWNASAVGPDDPEDRRSDDHSWDESGHDDSRDDGAEGDDTSTSVTAEGDVDAETGTSVGSTDAGASAGADLSASLGVR